MDLHNAARVDDWRGIAREVLDKNISVNEKDKAGRTPIYHALLHGHETTTMLLIACGAIVDEPWLNVIPSDALRTMLRKLMAAWQFNPLPVQRGIETVLSSVTNSHGGRGDIDYLSLTAVEHLYNLIKQMDYVMSFTSRRYRHIKLTKYAHWNQYQQQVTLIRPLAKVSGSELTNLLTQDLVAEASSPVPQEDKILSLAKNGARTNAQCISKGELEVSQICYLHNHKTVLDYLKSRGDELPIGVDLGLLLEKDTFSDIVFNVAGTKLYAHTAIILARAPKLAAKFGIVQPKVAQLLPKKAAAEDSDDDNHNNDEKEESTSESAPPVENKADAEDEEIHWIPGPIVQREIDLKEEPLVFCAILEYVYTELIRTETWAALEKERLVGELRGASVFYGLQGTLGKICTRRVKRQFEFAKQESSIGKDLKVLFNNPHMGPDRILKAEGKHIYVHSAVLSARSTYWRALFSSLFKEARETVLSVDWPFDTLAATVEFLYAGQLPEHVDSSLALQIVMYANEWLLLELVLAADKVAAAGELDFDTAIPLISTLDKSLAPKLRQACLNWLAENLSEALVSHKDLFVQIPEHVIMEVLRAMPVENAKIVRRNINLMHPGLLKD